MRIIGGFVGICLILALIALTPLIFVAAKTLDYFEDNCSLSGHSWSTDDKIYMRPVRRCIKCGQVQVKLPKLDKVSKGGWVDQGRPLGGRNS